MKRYIFLVAFSSLSMMTQAADVPDIVNENEVVTQQMCIDRATNDCINTVCMNSSALDCTDKCKSDAQDKCAGMSE